jgi:hypothetical protein
MSSIVLLQVVAGFYIVALEEMTDKTDNTRAGCTAVGRHAFVPTRLHIDTQRGIVVVVEDAARPGEPVVALCEVRQKVFVDGGRVNFYP